MTRAATILLRAARLGQQEAVRDRLVAGGRVAQIGVGLPLPRVGEGVEVVEPDGRSLLPGLWDAHACSLPSSAVRSSCP